VSAFAAELVPNASILRASGRLRLTDALAAAHAAVFSGALFSERDVVARGAQGEMLPLGVATIAPTALGLRTIGTIRLAVANSNMLLWSDSLETGTGGSNSLPSPEAAE
jgi:hypothetical protein